MQFKIKNIFYLLIFVLLSGCSKELGLKSDLLPGSWDRLERTVIYKNGTKIQRYEKSSFVEFFDNNCGTITSQSQDETHDIKWAYQEGGSEDKFLISTTLNTSNGPSAFSINTLHIVADIGKNHMNLVRDVRTNENGDAFTYRYLTYFVKVQ